VPRAGCLNANAVEQVSVAQIGIHLSSLFCAAMSAAAPDVPAVFLMWDPAHVSGDGHATCHRVSSSPDAAALNRCLSRYTGYPCISVLLTNWQRYATRQDPHRHRRTFSHCSYHTSPLDHCGGGSSTEAGRSSNSFCAI